MARLTVGLPVYNAMPLLPATMDSLLQQTYCRRVALGFGKVSKFLHNQRSSWTKQLRMEEQDFLRMLVVLRMGKLLDQFH